MTASDGKDTSGTDGRAMQEQAHHAAKRSATWLGMAINLPLAIMKILAGVIGNSQALVADGVHSLADLASDVTVLWALKHSARAPDAEHPWGHGRFETLATLAVAAALLLTAAGIVLDSAQHLFGESPQAQPGVLALAAAVLSILLKEALYHYTVLIGRRTGSSLIIANAWHHRSDALSSVVAGTGVLASMAGVSAADLLAALIIAVMLARVAWAHGWPAVRELVDSQPAAEARDAVSASLTQSPGVAGVRDLRLRQHGKDLIADASLLVDPLITVTEGHRIAESARDRAISQVPSLTQIVLHVEPEGHHAGYGATSAPLRHEIEDEITEIIARMPGISTIGEIRLGYFDHGITVEVVATLEEGADHHDLERAMIRQLRLRNPAVTDLRLHAATSTG